MPSNISTRPTDYLAAAWHAVPGLDDLVSGLELARATTITAPPKRITTLQSEIRAAFSSGEPEQVDALLAQVPVVLADEKAADDTAAQLRVITAGLRSSITQGRIDGADHALGYLAGELDLIMAELGERIGALKDVTSAADAIRVGASDEWMILEDAAARYGDLRAAQVAISIPAYGGTGVAEIVADVGIVHDGPRRRLAGDLMRGVTVGTHTRIPAGRIVREWPDDAREQLLWALRTGARLWVPGIQELREAQKRTSRAVKATPSGQAVDYAMDETGPARVSVDGTMTTNPNSHSHQFTADEWKDGLARSAAARLEAQQEIA